MPRVYTSYNDEDFEQIIKECGQTGMTPSSFQKYCVLLYLGHNVEEMKKVDIDELKKIMEQNLKEKNIGDPFIVSSLLPPEEWTQLNRSEKITLSLFLKNIIESQPETYRVRGVLHNNIKQYERY